MGNRTTIVFMFMLCCPAWAAEDVAPSPPEAASLTHQTPGYEVDAVTIPRMLSYQGKLTDTAGRAVRDSEYTVLFGLYTVPSGGSAFWNETQTVRTKSGLFSVLLGSVTPIGSMPDAGAAYLGMAVAGGAELTPRLRIASAAYAYLTERAANSDLLQGKDTTGFVRTGQANSVTSAMITNGTIAAADLNQMGAATNQVLKWTGSVWEPRNDSVGGSGGGGTVTSVSQATGVVCTPNPITTTGTVAFDQTYGDGRYVNLTGDSMTGALALQGDLRTYGKGRIGPSNTNTGTWAFAAGCNNSADGDYGTVSGGYFNSASGYYATVAGGNGNVSSGGRATVGGGNANLASGSYSTVAGGRGDTAVGYAAGALSGWGSVAGDAVEDTGAVVAGGKGNRATGRGATVSGGHRCWAGSDFSTVCGGRDNSILAPHATICGGAENTASGDYAAVLGGYRNCAVISGTVAGGQFDTSIGAYSLTAGMRSRVHANYSNSAAFNGTAANASSQTSVGTLKQGFAAFGIDHPLDPDGRILNQYVTGSDQALMIYRGVATIGADGQTEVQLPRYFDALCQDPMIQLTGVGTGDVFVAREEQDNRFTIGGRAGTKVYWTVTGERRDRTAEIGRALQPVEMKKTGDLAGVSLDDDFLCGCMEQLVREGKAQGIDFRTAAGKEHYQKTREMARGQ